MALEINSLGGNCPVQAEGQVDGEPFYFRARGAHWSMSIGSDTPDTSALGVYGRDVVSNPKWFYEEDFGVWPDAGWMSEDEARAFIDQAVTKWRKAELEAE